MTQEQVQRMCDTMTRIFAARGGPFVPYYTVNELKLFERLPL